MKSEKKKLDILHEKIKLKELIQKHEINKKNILSDKTKKILLNKIKNEVIYIKKILLKKEYENSVEYKFLNNYDSNYLLLDYEEYLSNDSVVACRISKYIFSKNLILRSRYLELDDIDKILNRQKRYRNNDHIHSHKLIKYFRLHKDDEIFKEIVNISDVFSNYLKNCDDEDYDDDDDDENIDMEEYYRYIENEIQR